jgi:O-antigen/teichoic acid export membrane protein
LLRGSGIIAFGMAIRILLAFATEVIAARTLLPERYGLLTWGLFITNILCMLSGLGLSTAARRFIPVYYAQQKWGALRGVVLFSGTLSTIGGFLGSLLLFLAAGWLTSSVMGDERELPVLLVFVFMVPLWNLQKTMLAVFGGFKSPLQKVIIEDLLVPFGYLSVVLIAWWAGWKEVAIARGYVIVLFLSVLLAIVWVRSRTPYYASRTYAPDFHIKETLRFSLPLSLTDALGKSTVGFIDVLIVGALATTHAVGVFRTASDIAVIMSLVLMNFGFMYFPIVAELAARGELLQWRELNARIARWSTISNFPIFATLFLFPTEVIQTIYGLEYLEAAPLLRILAVGYFFHAVVGFTGMNLVAAGMSHLQLVANLAGLGVNVLGNWLLVPRIGIEGAAVASLLSLVVINGVCLAMMKQYLGFHPFTRSYIHSFGILFAITIGIGLFLKTIGILSGIMLLFSFLVLTLVCIGLVSLQGCLLDATDRSLFRSALNAGLSYIETFSSRKRSTFSQDG